MTDQIILVVAFGFAFFSIWLSYKVWRLGNEVSRQYASDDEEPNLVERDTHVELDIDAEPDILAEPDMDVELNIAEALEQTDQEISRIQLLVERLAASDMYSLTATRLSESLGAQRALVENLSGIERARSAAEADIDPAT
jgi:hypothetical protein